MGAVFSRGLRLFISRMGREGRLDEWDAIFDGYIKRGESESGAARRTASGMGYVSARIEEGYCEVADDWESAMDNLPIQSDPRKELDWVRSHPAMVRHSRQSDKTKPVSVTVEDIVGAPSRAAVNSLCTWVDHPYEFQKQWLNEQKKKVELQTSDGIVLDVGLSEVERLLREFQGG